MLRALVDTAAEWHVLHAPRALHAPSGGWMKGLARGNLDAHIAEGAAVLEIRTGSILFPRANGQGPRIGVQELVFPRPVLQAIAVLTGTNFGFSPRKDRELGRVNIWLQTAVASERVKVTATFGVRDWSRDWDDEYEGAVHYALLAELAPADGAGGMEPTAAPT